MTEMDRGLWQFRNRANDPIDGTPYYVFETQFQVCSIRVADFWGQAEQ